MNEILITILVGILLAAISNVIAHLLALHRQWHKHDQDYEETETGASNSDSHIK